eukprot:SAG25_NODE_5282_length_678_cov_0.948187_1_plen_83_part_10
MNTKLVGFTQTALAYGSDYVRCDLGGCTCRHAGREDMLAVNLVGDAHPLSELQTILHPENAVVMVNLRVQPGDTGAGSDASLL